ncbi:MAG: helix-turn-helix domain-containing protein [bacterium]|nr:helix-turn-helix domain-containing protein [bacterium]
MDEILIEDKKYVSSKQAAKVTGYAKDYVGQLCREGRVPARLVGRSWYVLESALHDHRFGDQKTEQEIQQAAPSPAELQSTWESPRYEASSAEVLPSVNRLQHLSGRSDTGDVGDEQNEVSQHLQDSWKAWFARFEHVPTESVVIAEVAPEKPKNEPVETEIEIEPEVSIPIRTVYEPQQTLQEEPQPNDFEVRPPSEIEMVVGSGRRVIRALQLFGVVFAMAIATIAVIGSGYFDKYIISNSQVSLIAGVAVYNK